MLATNPRYTLAVITAASVAVRCSVNYSGSAAAADYTAQLQQFSAAAAIVGAGGDSTLHLKPVSTTSPLFLRFGFISNRR